MASVAGRDGAQPTRLIRIAAVALMLGISACDNNAAQTATTEGADLTTQGPGGSSSTATGASDPAGATFATPGGTLDTSSWVLAAPFYAAGDEPFWRMEIVDGWFSFTRSGLRAIEEPLVQPAKEGGADVFETGALRVTISREACSMEQGRTSEFVAKVTFEDLNFDGCAFAGHEAAASNAAASAEAETVAESLLPIDACLARLGQPALATAIYPRQDGQQIAVGLRAKTGALYECVTEGGGASVVSLDPIEQGAQPAWMNRMRFLRDGLTAAGPCADAEEVRVGDLVVGRLLTRACKF